MKLQLLGGLTARQFLRDYWHKKPLLVRNAIPGFGGLLSPAQMQELACREDVESRLVRGGKAWSLGHGPFRAADFKKLPKRAWTLLVQSLDGNGTGIQTFAKDGSLEDRALYKPYYNGWEPRLGVWWSATDRLVLRGGYGIGYERNFGNVTYNVLFNPPQYLVTQVDGGVDVPILPIYTDNQGPFGGNGGITKPIPAGSLRHVDQNIETAYSHFYSLSLQRELFANTVASVEYSGSSGRKLYDLADPNKRGAPLVYTGVGTPSTRPLPQYGAFNDAMLVFARTKQATVELAERLEARGFAAAPLNGDIVQAQRERTVAALKAGKVDIVVATDVAARGLDVERITHVVNFDVPYDSESYVHRIGRTGRAGRSGEAILFIAPRERNMLRIIERATRQPIEPMCLPTLEDVSQRRAEKFKEEISAAMSSQSGEPYRAVLESYVRETGADLLEVAAALASLAGGGRSLAVTRRRDSDANPEAPTDAPAAGDGLEERRPKRATRHRKSDAPQATYRLEVGRQHGVQPGNIVGAIAHTADELTWRSKAMIVGGVVGAAVGVTAAYMLAQRSKHGQPPQMSVGEGVKIGVLVFGLLRSIANL